MVARILVVPPLSGTLEEHTFQLAGDPVWVLFEPDDGSDWAGAFGSNEIRPGRPVDIAFLDTPPVAYVVAGGRDYVLDYQSRELIWWSDGSLSQGVLAMAPSQSFVVWDEIRFRSIDPQGRVLWVSERVSWDGFREIHEEGGLVKGQAWFPGNTWVSFTVDAATGEHAGGSYRS
jgi:hypothetical protein